MREIKFRAWNTEETPHRMNYFDLRKYMTLREFDQEELCPCNARENLMQYTDLKDKNGKEVYEGDIVKVADNEYYEVEFDCGGFMAGDIFLDDYWNPSHGYLFEVIGNKFDNPELLEVEE